MTFAYWEPVIIFTMINVIIISGLYINAMSGILSMATAAIAGIGGYAAAILTTNFAWPFLPAVAMAFLAGALVGATVALITLKMRDFVLKLTTLAFGEAVTVIALNIDYIGGANSFSGIPFYTNLEVVVVATALALYVAWRFDGSRLGIAARAVRDDPDAARANGVSVREARITTFTLGAAIVGAGGAIQAHYVLIVTPHELGFFSSFYYIIYLLVGGSYGLWGPVASTIVLTAAPELIRFTGAFRLVLFGLIVLLIILFRPQGLVSRRPTGVEPFLVRQWRRRFGALPAPLDRVLRLLGSRAAPASRTEAKGRAGAE